LKRAENSLQNAFFTHFAIRVDPRQPTPARMRSRNTDSVGRGQQHGQAVGHHDGASHAVLGGDAGIRYRTVWRGHAEMFNAHTMHLL